MIVEGAGQSLPTKALSFLTWLSKDWAPLPWQGVLQAHVTGGLSQKSIPGDGFNRALKAPHPPQACNTTPLQPFVGVSPTPLQGPPCCLPHSSTLLPPGPGLAFLPESGGAPSHVSLELFCCQASPPLPQWPAESSRFVSFLLLSSLQAESQGGVVV